MWQYHLKTWDDGIFRKDPVGCKTVVDYKCLQQVKNFKYLDYGIFYENEKKINKKIKNAQIVGYKSNIFKPTLVQKSSRIKVYDALISFILLYGSEIRVIKTGINYDWPKLRLISSEG